MKLREWFKNCPLLTAFFLFLILSLSIGIVYLSITNFFSLNDILIGLGLKLFRNNNTFFPNLKILDKLIFKN
ncbi:MAG: hypothetical protein EU547_07145 [Promethearchaeota archaeon]|nr:MAG: hypothetical protein EU547_07145 [Candidatus Lokiarchaeota archaeon]